MFALSLLLGEPVNNILVAEYGDERTAGREKRKKERMCLQLRRKSSRLLTGRPWVQTPIDALRKLVSERFILRYNGSQKGCGIPVTRCAVQKSENAIYELLCELEGVSLDKEGSHEAYRNYTKDDKMCCLVAETDKEVAGVLNLRTGTMLCRCGKIGEVVELATRNSMRFQGIGHGLFQEAYHVAREADCVRFEVSTNRTRLGVHRFCEREGMERSHYRFIRYFPIEK